MMAQKKSKWISFYAIWTSLCVLSVSCKSESEIKYEQYVISGKNLYEKHCANCHGKNGEGLNELYPSLAQSKSLSDVERITCLIQKGSTGQEFNMPANKHLYAIDIAQIITYMNNRWGDKKALTETEEVAKVNC